MKLVSRGVILSALTAGFSVEARRKKYNKNVVSHNDDRTKTVNFDESQYNGHWQTIGACGVPMVTANNDIVTGIPELAYKAIDKLTRAEKVIQKTKTQRGHTKFQAVPFQPESSFISNLFGSVRRLNVGGRPQQSQDSEDGLTSHTETAKIIIGATSDEPLVNTPVSNDLVQFIKRTTSDHNLAVPTTKQVVEHPAVAGATGRVVGGRDSKPDTWPWQVHLTICGKWWGYIECNVCGASIISPTWLISAAHCVPKEPTGYVVYGTNDINSKAAKRSQLFNFITHPNWNPANFDSDVSLVKPRHVIDISAGASPICLPAPDTCWDEHTACVVTGWGLMSETDYTFPDNLQEVAVRLIDWNQCKTKFKNYGILSENMMCAGYAEGRRDACAGDSGGPLVCKLPGMNAWVLHGVVSWGYGCARQNAPGVYSKVSNFIDWIEASTGLNHDSNLSMKNNAFAGDSVNPETSCFKTSLLSEEAWYQRDISKIIEIWTEKVDGSLSMWQEKFGAKWDASTTANQAAGAEEATDPDAAPTGSLDLDQCSPFVSFGNLGGEEIPAVRTTQESLDGHVSSLVIEELMTEYGVNSAEATALIQGGSISSLFYPKPHPTKANCEYMIKNDDPSKKVLLSLNYANLDCRSKSYIYITNGDTEKQVRYCRMKRPIKFTSTVGFTVSFSADISKAKFKGWTIDYTFLDATHQCDTPKNNKLLVGERKLFKTPNYPKLYDAASQCRWSLGFEHQEGMYGSITLDFIKGIRTEKGVACGPENDNIIIFEAADCKDETLKTAEIWGSICGLAGRRVKHSFDSGKGLCVVFIADDDKRRGRGALFQATLKYVKIEQQAVYNVPTNR